MGDGLRLFVAIYPARGLAERWLAELSRLQLPPNRPTPIEQVHLTLQFIGDTPGRDVDRVIESVDRSSSGLPAFELTAHRLITLPQRGPARLVAAETDRPPTLLELHRRLVTRLAIKVRRRQDYRPHLTLCRFRGATSVDRINLELAPASFTVDRVALMRSVLRPTGAEHAEVSASSLIS